MKTILIAFRTLFKRGRNNVIKILSLSVGLAMGLVLTAKVYFEQSYNDFFPDRERIYQVQSNYTTGNDPSEIFPQTSGGIVVGMKDVMPEVEAATRYTYIALDDIFFTEDKSRYTGTFILADSALFDVLERPIVAGDVRQTLGRPMYAMVSSEIAERMGGIDRTLGQSIQLESAPGRVMTIGGVFEALPKNTHFRFDVVVSLASIEQFMWDGSLNWMGNDRYLSYVKLTPGATPESVRPGIDRVRDKYLDKATLRQAGVEIDYALLPLGLIHTSSREVTQTMWLLSILAFALLCTAVLNYLLVVVSSLVNRSKEMAVHKCYGASEGNIYGRMLAEALADVLVSLAAAAGLIYVFRGVISSLLGTEVGHLFTPASLWWLAGVCAAVFLVAGLASGYLYARVPVAMAFRRFSENRRRWKLGLLFAQFVAAGFFVTLLAIVGRQYNYMLNDNPGYTYDNLAWCNLSGLDHESRRSALEEVSRLPEVAQVTSTNELLLDSDFAGNNIRLPGDDRELFNIADLYAAGDGFLDLMEIPVVEGRSFTEGMEDSREVMVSRSFVERMKDFADWPDGPIGKSIYVTQHSRSHDHTFTICGVYDDVRLGTIGRQDNRPSVLFYTNRTTHNLIIRFHHQTPEALRKVSETLTALLPDKTIAVYSWPAEMVNRYSESRKFRDSVMTGGTATLLILLIGLLGYTNDEMNRRRRETAIRKINGATVFEIERLFLSGISRMALPAIALGCGAAWYVAEGWLEKFADKASLPLALFLVCGLAVLILILTSVALNCYRTATANPSLALQSE
ncbi:MAG: ABC transporter permease [Tannerellaceae bacterium]|jgi:putative ABC transport system permease protein|nr:ABC transporter permease [Tannerellaceae bacterium]